MDTETKKKLNDISKVNLSLIPVKLDLTTLNMTMYFIYKDSVLRTRKVLKFTEVNPDKGTETIQPGQHPRYQNYVYIS